MLFTYQKLKNSSLSRIKVPIQQSTHFMLQLLNWSVMY